MNRLSPLLGWQQNLQNGCRGFLMGPWTPFGRFPHVLFSHFGPPGTQSCSPPGTPDRRGKPRLIAMKFRYPEGNPLQLLGTRNPRTGRLPGAGQAAQGEVGTISGPVVTRSPQGGGGLPQPLSQGHQVRVGPDSEPNDLTPVKRPKTAEDDVKRSRLFSRLPSRSIGRIQLVIDKIAKKSSVI